MKAAFLLGSALIASVAVGVCEVGRAAAESEQATTSKPATVPGNDGAMDAAKETMVPDDTSGSRNAARTRMRECGHQWSTMKKSGAASGLTWKDFSQSCLARK